VLGVAGAGPLALASAGSASAATGADHTVMYVANSGNNTVTAYDTTAGRRRGPESRSAVSPGTCWPTPSTAPPTSSNQASGTVSVIDTATDTVTGTIQVGAGPEELALSPDGSTLYVADEVGNAISAVNTATNTVTATYTGLAGPSGLAVSPDGSTVYASLYNASEVVAVSTATGDSQVLYTFNSGDHAGLQNMAISPNGDEVYTAVEYEDFAASVAVGRGSASGIPVKAGPTASRSARTDPLSTSATPTATPSR
jgi:YVTN family beta-propeller protein